MAAPSQSPLQRQLTQVSRRMFMQTFVDRLVWYVVGALVLATAWFLVQPWLIASAPDALRWVVAGGLAGACLLSALVHALLTAPSRLSAALCFDEKFGLKERVTTSLTLSAEQAQTPAGQALLADVNQRIGSLDVGERFPLRLSRTMVLVPATAVLFACVALLYDPSKGQAKVDKADDPKQPPTNVAAIEEKMKELTKKNEKRPTAKPKSEELEKLEAKLEEIANRPRDTKEQLRERIKEMKAVEDAMAKREKDLADKQQSLQQQLKKLDRLSKDGQDGPAKDLQKALSEGNMDKAKQEMDKLAEKMQKNDMSDKEKQQLGKQLQDIEDKLKRLAEHQDKKGQLEKLKQEGKLDKEAFEREMKHLQQDAEKLKDLQDLANKLGECKQCMEKGDGKGAMEKLQQAADKLKNMDIDDQELKDLREQMQKLQEAKQACGKGCKGDGRGDTDQPNEGGIGAGRRPLGEETDTKSFETKAKTDFDPSGKKIFDGFAPGQNFKKKSGAEIAGEIEQARQEAPEAIEQQRIPKAARDMAKGYFRNLGGQGDKAPKKADKKDE